MAAAQEGAAKGAKQVSSVSNSTSARPPQPFRLLGDITAGIVDDLGHRRARLLVEERPDG